MVRVASHWLFSLCAEINLNLSLACNVVILKLKIGSLVFIYQWRCHSIGQLQGYWCLTDIFFLYRCSYLCTNLTIDGAVVCGGFCECFGCSGNSNHVIFWLLWSWVILYRLRSTCNQLVRVFWFLLLGNILLWLHAMGEMMLYIWSYGMLLDW